MNVNDDLSDTVKVQQRLLASHNYNAYVMLTLTTQGRASVDAAGEFSELFKALFSASCENDAIRALVKATAEALKGWEYSREAKAKTVGDFNGEAKA